MLTKREEIASRLLAGMMANPENQGSDSLVMVGWSIQATDELIAKLAETEPQPKPADRPSWDDAPGWAQWLAADKDGAWYWYESKPKIGLYGFEPIGNWEATGFITVTEDWQSTLGHRYD